MLQGLQLREFVRVVRFRVVRFVERRRLVLLLAWRPVRGFVLRAGE
jgi:hypothetical protein